MNVQNRALISIDPRPLLMLSAAGGFMAVAFGLSSIMLEWGLIWWMLFVAVSAALFVGGARFGHKMLGERDLNPENRFAAELLLASAATLPAQAAGLFLISHPTPYADATRILFENFVTGLVIGGLPALLKLKWLSDCQKVQKASVSAIKESERLMSLEQLTDAEEKLRESILAHECQFGSNHVLTARMILRLANFFGRIGDKDKAAILIRRALFSFELVLGPSAPEVADCVLELVKVDPNTDIETVLPLLRRAQIVREQQFGAESRQVAEVCGYLGGAYFSSGKWNDAVDAYRRSLNILEKILPETDPERIQTSGRLASSYVRAGRPIEAEKLIRGILDFRKELDLPHDNDYLLLLSDYAQLQHRQSKFEEERRILLEALQVLVESVGPTAPGRDELLRAATDYLRQPGSPEHQAFAALLSADGMAIRKIGETNAAVLDTPDAFGWRPLQWATFLSLDRIIDTLLYAKVSMEPEDTDWPPLQIAIRWALKRPLQALLQKGANSSTVSTNGWSALHRAAQGGDDRIIDALALKGASANVANSEGDTPLLLAARLGHTRVVVELLHHGADPLSVNAGTGRSALHEAAARGKQAVVECIILNCPDALSQTDDKGRSALELARLNGQNEVAAFLEKSLKLDKKEREKEEKAQQLKSKEVAV